MIKDNRGGLSGEETLGQKKNVMLERFMEASCLVHWIKSQVDPLQESPQQKVQRLGHAGPRSQGGHGRMDSRPHTHKIRPKGHPPPRKDTDNFTGSIL